MKALITGITGQDGSYLAEFLLSRGYEVHGTIRPASNDHLDGIQHLRSRLFLHQGDLADQISLLHLMEEVRPDELYNLAALPPISTCWKQPEIYGQINALGVVRLLEAIRQVKPDTRFFQASSYDMFLPASMPLDEQSPCRPITPYAMAKYYAHQTTVAYREQFNLKTCCGLLFSHESPRRNPVYLTRHITRSAVRVKLGLQDKLRLNSLSLQADWGYAGDFVRSFWMMLQQPAPDDYVIATGRSHSLEDFCRLAFAAVDLDWQDHVAIDNPLPEAEEMPVRIGNITQARRRLLWEPEVSFEQMVRMMVDFDHERYTLKNRLSADFLNRQLQEDTA